MLTCPECGRECKTPAALGSHLRSCRTRPTPQQLAQLMREHCSLAEMAQQFSTTAATIRKWLDQAGFKDYRRDGKSKFICPMCQGEFKSGAGLKSHERTCSKRPDDEVLTELVENGARISEMSGKLGVRDEILHRWLDEIGQGDYRKNQKEWEKKPLELVTELAPLFGRIGGCENCPVLEECQKRQVARLWALCEAPESDDVRAAVRDGLLAPESGTGFTSRSSPRQ